MPPPFTLAASPRLRSTPFHDRVVARSGWSKQGGFEIYLRDGSLGGALWDRIMDAGRPFGIRPGAPNLIERIESRLISYGADVTLEHDPFEAGLEAFCDLDKPAEYLARGALAARRGRPPARWLERVVIGGGRRPPGGRLAIPPCGTADSPPYTSRARRTRRGSNATWPSRWSRRNGGRAPCGWRCRSARSVRRRSRTGTGTGTFDEARTVR